MGIGEGIFMKKIAVLAAMIFVISPGIFAVENCYFTWQLYSYYNSNNSLSVSFENNGINKNLFNNYDTFFESSEHLVIFFLEFLRMLNGINEIFFGSEARRAREIEDKRKSLDPMEIPNKRNNTYQRF
jgi:hypothetical protein